MVVVMEKRNMPLVLEVWSNPRSVRLHNKIQREFG